jgi:hypothetical protein
LDWFLTIAFDFIVPVYDRASASEFLILAIYQQTGSQVKPDNPPLASNIQTTKQYKDDYAEAKSLVGIKTDAQS